MHFQKQSQDEDTPGPAPPPDAASPAQCALNLQSRVGWAVMGGARRRRRRGRALGRPKKHRSGCKKPRSGCKKHRSGCQRRWRTCFAPTNDPHQCGAKRGPQTPCPPSGSRHRGRWAIAGATLVSFWPSQRAPILRQVLASMDDTCSGCAIVTRAAKSGANCVRPHRSPR